MPNSRPKDLRALIRTACPCKLHLGCGAALEEPEALWAGIGGPETTVRDRGGATRCTLAQGGARRGGAGGETPPGAPAAGGLLQELEGGDLRGRILKFLQSLG